MKLQDIIKETWFKRSIPFVFTGIGAVIALLVTGYDLYHVTSSHDRFYHGALEISHAFWSLAALSGVLINYRTR